MCTRVCVDVCVLVCVWVPLFVPHRTSWGLFSVFLLVFLLVFSICNAIFRFWPAGIGLRVDNATASATAADVARGWRCRQRWQRLRLETWQVRGATAKLVWRRLKVVQGVRYKFAVPAVPTVRLSARIYAPEMPLASCVLWVCVCAWPTAEFSQFSSISQRRLLAILQVANCELHFHNLIKSRIDCCPSRRDVACQLAMVISHISPLNEPPRPARELEREREGGGAIA